MGEILSSTILEKCSDFDTYDEVQKEIISRGPAFTRKVFEDLGVSNEELIKNGGKVYRKIRDTK